MNRSQKRKALSHLKREGRRHPRGYEGVADELGLQGAERALMLVLAQDLEKDGAAATVDALERFANHSENQSARSSLTDDQRRFLDAISERVMGGDGRAPDTAWVCSRLDWAPERVKTVAAELRELGLLG